jgi:hypothetical protein
VRKLLARVGALILGMAVLIVGVRQIGHRSTDRLAPMLGVGSTADSQACWYGICPGSTNRGNTVEVLNDVAVLHEGEVSYNPELIENGYVVRYDACATFTLRHWLACIKPDLVLDEHDYMVDLQLRDSDVQLGDVIARLGSPSTVWMCTGLIPSQTYTGARGVNVYLLYKNGISVSAFKKSKYALPKYPTTPDEWRIRVDMQVYEIEYYAAYSYYRGSRVYFAWRGFSEGPDIHYGCGN